MTDLETIFEIKGPYEVPVQKSKKTKLIGFLKEEQRTFWESHPPIGKCRGCYIFAIRAGGGFRPIYIGKATKSFFTEIFNPNNLNKYNYWLAKVERGKPVMFFVVYPPKKKGPVNTKHIGELEKYLIKQGELKNPELLNRKLKDKKEWGIHEILLSKKEGKPAKGVSDFKILFGL